MDKNKNLWLERWENREIGFNQEEPNPFMVHYFERLNLEKASQILVPLCGKTIDISWLLAQGYSVVGIELSETAVRELFEELGVVPTVLKREEHTFYSTENLTVKGYF